jgi:phage gpG-like protein
LPKSRFDLDKVVRRLHERKAKLMTELEAVSTTHFVNSWRVQGWVDNGLHPWLEVQRRKPGTAAYNSARKSARTRAILVQSGALRRGFYTRIKRLDIIQIANSLPYAKVHNEGFEGTVSVKGHDRWMKSKGDYAGTGVYSVKTRKEKRVQLQYKQSIKGHSRKMNIPQRQFMGHSVELQKKQEQVIDNTIKYCFR